MAGTVASDDNNSKEVAMFTKLTAELLDLVVHEKGYRLALYASKSGDLSRYRETRSAMCGDVFLR